MMYPVLRDDIVPFRKEDKLCNFAPMPKAILGMGLPSTAILVYTLLLDRGTLSQKNGWHSKAGWVYVSYSIPNLSLALGKGESTIRKNLKELEDHELIYRTQPIANESSWIFLRVPESSVESSSLFSPSAENERLEKMAETPPFFEMPWEKSSA